MHRAIRPLDILSPRRTLPLVIRVAMRRVLVLRAQNPNKQRFNSAQSHSAPLSQSSGQNSVSPRLPLITVRQRRRKASAWSLQEFPPAVLLVLLEVGVVPAKAVGHRVELHGGNVAVLAEIFGGIWTLAEFDDADPLLARRSIVVDEGATGVAPLVLLFCLSGLQGNGFFASTVKGCGRPAHP